MAKKRTLFECQACGFQSAKWMGKCPNCDAWDQFLELSAAQQEILKETATKGKVASKTATPIT